MKELITIIFEILLFYATTYCGHQFWTERKKSKEEGYSLTSHVFWIVLTWIGLALFALVIK
jgi:hypothetical protein